MPINPLVGAALVSGGSSLLNSFSQAAANAKNLKIARETNEMNYKINKENNEFNRQMALEQWQRETSYNHPAMQMQRALQAGLNPFAVMGSQSNTTGVSNMAPPTSSGAIPMQAAHVEPLNFSDSFAAFSAIASALNQLGDAKKKGIETGWLDKQLEEQWKALSLDNNWKSFTQAIDKELYKNNAHWTNEQYRANVEKTYKEIDSLIESIKNQQKQGQIYDLDKAIKEFEKVIAHARSIEEPKILRQTFINAVKQGNNIDASTAKTNRERQLLGNTIDGVEMPKVVLDHFRERVRKEVQNASQRADIEKILNDIEKGELDSGVVQELEKTRVFLSHIPVFGEILDLLKDFAKAQMK